jgi:hypothetical protein
MFRSQIGGARVGSGKFFFPIDKPLASAIADRFLAAREDERRAAMLFRAVDLGNFNFFLADDPFPNTHVALNPRIFRERWNLITEKCRPLDVLLSRHTTDLISSFISVFDDGSWSHMSIYLGNGLVAESEPGHGAHIEPLGKYNDPVYRLALLRHHNPFQSFEKYGWRRQFTCLQAKIAVE